MERVTMNLTLRRVNADEAAKFRDIRLHALQQHPRAYAQTYEEEATQGVPAYRMFLEYNIVMGAYTPDDVLIGFTIFTPFRQSKLSHKGTVWGAYVEPTYRDQQLAKQMRLRLFEIAKAMGLRYITSSILANNEAALQVHRAVGYEETCREKGGIRNQDGTFEDIIHLIKYL